MGTENGDHPTVMVVEDFEDNRFMMRRLLEMSGYRVLEAVNGEEAVASAPTSSAPTAARLPTTPTRCACGYHSKGMRDEG